VRTLTHARNTLIVPFVLITAGTLFLTACGSGTDDATTAAARSDAVPTTDVVSSIRKDDTAAGLLPPGTTSLTLAVSVSGRPPGTSVLDDGRTLAGQDG
jgi:polar amino acid transport system substrate-binding protein